MSGGGKIIEKAPMTIRNGSLQVIRYRVMSEYRPGWFDETFVYAKPSDEEPTLGEAIWWGGEQVIYWGENDSKALKKVGYSFGVKDYEGD